MLTKLVITILGYLVIAICIPVMRFVNPKAFKLYVAYCTVIAIIWAVLLFGTNIII